MNVNAEVFDIDLYDNSASVVSQLHARGKKAICYISAGTWQRWRPDASKFPTTVKVSKVSGWAGEQWLDIRQWNVLGPIMEARLDLCKAKGFDGVEPDNVDGYDNPVRISADLSGPDHLQHEDSGGRSRKGLVRRLEK